MFVNTEDGCINVRVCFHGRKDFAAGSALLALAVELARGPRREGDINLVRTGDVLLLDYFGEAEVAPGYVAHPHVYAVAPGVDELGTRSALRKGDGLLVLAGADEPRDLETQMRDFLFMDPSAPIVRIAPGAPLLPAIDALLDILPFAQAVADARPMES